MARVRYQLDEHIPNAVAQALRRRGLDAITSLEAGLVGASDEAQLAHARAQGRVLVTHDGDFLRLSREGYQHAGIAYAKQRSRTIGQLVASLLLIYEALESSEMEGQVEFL